MEDRKITILAIDDNQDNLISLNALIKEAFPRAQTLTALNGARGLDLAAAEDPDVILLDVVMPGMDGFEVCKKLKADKKLSDIPVVFVTAIKGDRQSRILALEAGGEAFLAKPIDESELVAQIRAMVKIKTANSEKRDEKKRLTALVEEQTLELKRTHAATLRLLDDLRKENEARKKSEEILRESEHQMRKLSRAVEQSPASIIITNTEGVIEYVNPKFTELTGYSAEEVTGKNPRLLKSGETSREEYVELWTTILSGKEWWGEFQNRKKDGSLYWESASISPIFDEKGTITHFLAVKEDIEERKKVEEQRELLEQQLFRSQRTESIGTLAAGIAHDFNNILNVIMGNADLLIAAKGDQEKVRRRIDAILKASDRGSSVVKQLLTLAQKTDIQPSVLDVNDIIEETITLLEETFPKTVVLKTSLDRALPRISADSNQLHQVLLNLSMNARDAMPKGGTLLFTTGIASAASLPGRFPAGLASPYLKITISDDGHGMTEEVQKRIFDPFYTTKEKGKGTGLGLAVVMGIVESHRGVVDVSSVLGQGSEFSIYLPAMEQGAFAEEFQHAAPATDAGGHETILFIEDETLIRETAVEALSAKGYTVLTAADGEEGVEMYRAHKDTIDFVFSDYGLPKFDGEEVYARIRRLNADVRFILLTGFMEPQMKNRLIGEGVLAIIPKPYKLNALLGKLRELLDLESVKQR